MKKFLIFFSVAVGLCLLSACTFYPVVSQVEFEARQTAQAQVVLPTVTPEPPTPPASEPEVFPEEEVGEVDPEPTLEPPSLDIKGNISSSGEKIYHVPSGAYYDQVKIDEAAGEMWFRTEEEAVAAGWRKSSR